MVRRRVCTLLMHWQVESSHQTPFRQTSSQAPWANTFTASLRQLGRRVKARGSELLGTSDVSTVWPKFLHYSHYFALELISALHALYRKYFLSEIIWLYITLSWPQPLSCTFFYFHYITLKFRKQINFWRCPSTVSCTVPSGESPNFRWIPGWEPN